MNALRTVVVLALALQSLCAVGAPRSAPFQLGDLWLAQEGRGYSMVRAGERVYRALPATVALPFEDSGTVVHRLTSLVRCADKAAPAFVATEDGVSTGPCLGELALSRRALEVYFERGRARQLLAESRAKPALVHAWAALAARTGSCNDPFEVDLCNETALTALVARCELDSKDAEAARTTLAPLLARTPLETVVALEREPVLGPLLALPSVAALHEKAPTARSLVAKLRTVGVLRAHGRDWLAVYRPYKPAQGKSDAESPSGVWLVMRKPTDSDPEHAPGCASTKLASFTLSLGTPKARDLAERVLHDLAFEPVPSRKEGDTIVVPHLGSFSIGIDGYEGGTWRTIDGELEPRCAE